ncbi:MAG: thioredoxin family protein [Dechloromonas sp.]|nr:thioredoxin family protein [Dechloromonas sp.]
MPPSPRPFSVICLCAEWCPTCREYQFVFRQVGQAFPNLRFRWLDIEIDTETVGDLDIENFPTLLIHRESSVLFYGVMRPMAENLVRLLEHISGFSAAECHDYIRASLMHRQWQSSPEIRHLVELISRDDK